MKKLFTIIALLAMFMGAKAEVVTDYFVDYSTWTTWDMWKMGTVPQIRDGVLWSNPANHTWIEEKDADGNVVGGHYADGSDEEKFAGWYQYFMVPAFDAQIGTAYDVTFKVKGSAAGSFDVNFQWGWGNGERHTGTVNFTEEWDEVTVSYPESGGSRIDLILQATFPGDIEIAWVKVTHNQKVSKPRVFKELLVNGDAEKPWSEVLPLGENTPDDDPENFNVCAWGKEYTGRDAANGNAEISHPHPATIVEEADGNHVFIVRHKAVNPNEYPDFFLESDGSVKGDPAWQNQFWIESPHAWKGGEIVKISFRYKASQNTGAVDTQCHAATPGSYLHWSAIGSIPFTTEWQEFSKEVTLPDAGKGMYSIAFNLGSADNWKDDIDFYFDDLKWGELELEHGYFVAGCNTVQGTSYEFDEAVEMVYNEDEELYIGVIGEIGKPETYVDQVMISTVRGDDQMFRASTLGISESITGEEDQWAEVSEKANAKLNLPGEGVWQVSYDAGYNFLNFVMIEGTVKEPIEVVANPTEIKVEALERDDLKDDDHPEGTGNTWDNQMWICAKRTLSKGEVTYLEFKYKADKEAPASTQSHKAPGEYLHWAAIGTVEFGTDWQTFERSFTVENDADGMQSIAFNLAEIKEANNYYIKDVIWVVGSKEESYESLIDTTGDKHLAWKVVGGAITVGDPAGIDNVVAAPVKKTGLYNLAGQKVNKNYKGIVIKDGNKIIVK